MNRRQFLVAATGLALLSGCGVLPNLAKLATPGVARVGILGGSPGLASDIIGGLKPGLGELGYVDGQNIVFEQRDTGGNIELEPELANELVRLPVAVIVAVQTQAARQVTTVIPIVFAVVTDPVGQGLIASLDHPGGNLTGVSNAPATVWAKPLEFLAQLVPRLSRVAILINLALPSSQLQFQALTTAANGMGGVQLNPLDLRTPDDMEPALVWQAQAMIAFSAVSSALPRLLDFEVQHRIPVSFTFKEAVQAGGFLSYGPSYNGIGHAAAAYVDKIVKGARPADLPVEQPTVFELVVNQTTAQALGITIPPDLAVEVTEWVQ
jgi:ABC-type uncharacterized transport system substrate-binding protein